MELLENGIGNIGKWNYWKMVLETLEMVLETLENEIRNIGKWHWICLKRVATLENRNWHCEMDFKIFIGKHLYLMDSIKHSIEIKYK